MSDIRERIVDALMPCLDEWAADLSASGGVATPFAANKITDVLLALPGVAIVKLPEPDEYGNFWYGSNHVYADTDHLVMTKYGTTFGTAEEVREIAAALLAAADAAEQERR